MARIYIHVDVDPMKKSTGRSIREARGTQLWRDGPLAKAKFGAPAGAPS
ncbi:MAG: hypothetical protein LBD54_03380 [Puniceicoccales bacterium]|nr:hypothetical protein [Puniceicoccales bacterium]